MVDSPLYPCQFVFVTKLIAVFQAETLLDVGHPVVERQPGLHPLQEVEDRQPMSEKASTLRT